MARFALCLIACALVAAVAATPADQEFLTKQKEIVKLLNKVHELNFYQDQHAIGTEYDPLAHLDNYKVSTSKFIQGTCNPFLQSNYYDVIMYIFL